MNELRSWFPATRLTTDSPNTTLIDIGSPGVHSDVGGHWGNNRNIQLLNFRTMIEYAQRYSTARFEVADASEEIQAMLDSDLTAFYVLDDAEGKIGTSYIAWREVAENVGHWRYLTRAAYVRMANSTVESDWRPGPVGLQNGWFLNFNMFRLVGGFDQPLRDHFPRKLNWISIGLWNTFSGINSEFMRSLYSRRSYPHGGWDVRG
jgi:hypothetical protein